MEEIMKKLLFIAVLAGLFGAQAHAQDLVQYKGTITTSWSMATAPTGTPNNPHFSPVVGATHDTGYNLYQFGGLASLGVQRVAETGNRTVLVEELNGAVASGNVHTLILGAGIPLSPGKVEFLVNASDDQPLISLITMVAPSPDWFIGVSNLNLKDNDGFVKRIKVPLYAIDAGTDSGKSYLSPNKPTIPPEVIAPLTDAPLFVNNSGYPVFGYLELEIIE